MSETRFKLKNPKIGVLVAIRGDESFDRYTVLKQGDYTNGRYGTQYNCGVFSPFMDLSTEDLWKITTLLDLDANEIYSMYWDAGVPLADQRIGSPVNVHAKDSVKLFKVLNPGTYSKMVGRLSGVDFTAAYGGVFTNGFKYIKLEQAKPFYQGIISSESLVKALNYLGVNYTIRDINEKFGSEKTSTVHNSATEPVKTGMNITLAEIHKDFLRKEAAAKAEADGDPVLAKYFLDNVPKIKTWYDYTKQLVNEAEPMFQKGWMPKIATSMKHWAKTGSAVNETTIAAWEVVSERKDMTFGKNYPETYEKFVDWAHVGYTDLSRKPILKLFRYQQDCGENTANDYISDIITRWAEGGKEELLQNGPLCKLLFEGGLMPRMPKPVICFTDAPSSGEIRECVLRNVNWSESGLERTGNGKYKNIEESKANTKDVRVKLGVGEDYTCDKDQIGENYDDTWKVFIGKDANGDKIYVDGGMTKGWRDTDVVEALKKVANRTFHDNVRDGGGSWKRATIMCLRNDIKGTYMGFGQSLEEKLIRTNAEAAFADNEQERQKKMAELESIKKKMEEEKAVK